MQWSIESLGEAQFLSPLRHGHSERFKNHNHRVLYDDMLPASQEAFTRGEVPLSFEIAGPREKIFCDPPKATAAIVTCGGLCPGENDIIRGILQELANYDGAQQGYAGRDGCGGSVPRVGQWP